MFILTPYGGTNMAFETIFTGPADGSKVDGIVLLELVHIVWWHIPPPLLVGFAAPVKRLPLELEGSHHA